MKYIIRVLLFSFLLFVSSDIRIFASVNSSIKLTMEEQQWLSKNKERIFMLGISPYSGMDYFKYKGEEKGYLIPLINIMKKDLDLNIQLEASKSWGEVYSGLQTGSIDILFGANETAERKKIMAFTRPVYKNPYALIAKKEGSIHTIGDIDKKTIGFIKNDVVIDVLPTLYKNIKYQEKFYDSQEECIAAIKNNEIDALITSGGPIVYDYIYRYPELSYAFKLSAITSDMTFSCRKEEDTLVHILDKEIQYLESHTLSELINKGEIEYNIKIMNLTEKEIRWLHNYGQAVVGVTKDYLPIDYFDKNQYKGISGEILKEISRKTGIEFTYAYGEFDDLNTKLRNGEVDILNIAKTEDRLKYVLYPRPYSTERDIIVGRKDSKDVRDIFGLEGKKVAVIKGFWHYEHLIKNLTNVKIIDTNSIQESLNLVHSGKADYLIENPTVVRYYTEELQLYDLVEKGVTSTDSYLYYGISKNKPELATIIDKVIPLMDIGELTKAGYEEVPHMTNKSYLKKLIFTIIALGILLLVIILYVIRLIKALIKEKTESELLRQKEHFLYMDSLTNLHNRNYFNVKIKDTLDSRSYPQTFIIGDLNNLKIVNDRYGHLIGDKLLKVFADILEEVCPIDSLMIRMGGDEFLIIIENNNEMQAEKIIENIKTVTAERSIMINETESIAVTVALGYSCRYSSQETFEDLFRIADKKMYLDKKRFKKI